MEKLKDDIIHEVIPEWLRKALQTNQEHEEEILQERNKINTHFTQYSFSSDECFKTINNDTSL